jgi:hypothetical protein
MSETTGSGETRERNQPDPERADPSIAGKPEVTAMDEGADMSGEEELPTGKSEERAQRQHAVQQHGDTFAVDKKPTGAEETNEAPGSNRVSALPGNEPNGDAD